MPSYEQRATEFALSLKQAPGRLKKPASNLFRDRGKSHRGLDPKKLTHVLDIDAVAGWLDTEAMIPYDKLVGKSLQNGVMPCVVPQLKSITIGGAVAGIGIESSSFRYGLVHESVLELDVALASGDLVTCTPENEHADLFYGFPNSYGTLGYATRVRSRTIPVKPYIALKHEKFSVAVDFFAAIAKVITGEADFVDGVVFDRNEFVLTSARFVDTVDKTSDYTGQNIYYRSVRSGGRDHLTTMDYIWRWDTDWFWCSKNFGAQNPLIRRMLGKNRLNSRFYTRVMRWNSRWKLLENLEKLTKTHRESVIQDVDIPIQNAASFLDFFNKEIGITPIWVCPVQRNLLSKTPFPLFDMEPDQPYINFGFWEVLRFRAEHPAGYFNRKIESMVEKLGGLKSLYSTSWYPEAEFRELYGGSHYRILKEKYDPHRRFPDLYEKCVRGT
jgi:FAD/FMN-containing dehydrogenase